MRWEDRPESENVEVVDGKAEADEGPGNQQYAQNSPMGSGFPLPFNLLGSFGIGTVNIGDRQKGRLRAASIIDCPTEAAAIAAALRRLLSPGFRAGLAGLVNPFGDGHASERIRDILATHPLDGLIRKSFVDTPSP